MTQPIHRLDEQGIVTICPVCGRRNRVRYETLDRPARCGSCHADLPPSQEPFNITNADAFASLVGQATLPVLVDFWAPWCGPCRMVAPEVARMAAASAGQVVVAKVDTEQVPELAQRYDIRSIPAFLLFSRGREENRLLGARPADELQAFARQAI